MKAKVYCPNCGVNWKEDKIGFFGWLFGLEVEEICDFCAEYPEPDELLEHMIKNMERMKMCKTPLMIKLMYNTIQMNKEG